MRLALVWIFVSATGSKAGEGSWDFGWQVAENKKQKPVSKA